jgi:hypothetical protein
MSGTAYADVMGGVWFESATEVPKNYVEVDNQDAIHTWVNSTHFHWTYRDADDWDNTTLGGGTSSKKSTDGGAAVTTFGQAKVFQDDISSKHIIQPVLVGPANAPRDLQILVSELDGDASTDNYFTQTYTSAVPGNQIIFRLTACEYGIFCVYAESDHHDFTFVSFTYSGASYSAVGGISTTASPDTSVFSTTIGDSTCTYVTRTEVLCHEVQPNGRIHFLTILPEVSGGTVVYPTVDYGYPDLGVNAHHIQVIRKLQGTNFCTGFVDSSLQHYMCVANGNSGDFDVGVTTMTGETGAALARKVAVGNNLSTTESYLNYPDLEWTGMMDLDTGSGNYLTVPISTTIFTVPRALYVEPAATSCLIGPEADTVIGVQCDGSAFSSVTTAVVTAFPSAVNGTQDISSYDGNNEFVVDGETEGNGNARFAKFYMTNPPPLS